MKIIDRRAPEQREKLTYLVVGTDPFMSGWGECKHGSSYAAWACSEQDWNDCECWVERRGDLNRVRRVFDPPSAPYSPNSTHCGHLSIYVWERGTRS